ncbi:hypothetical protein BT69DRAFT_1349727 [Atractiella rhizophila]|nr:hypothetical protein BT69DRAFT_1349727 [Atractiella rhizophila]
MASLLSTTQNWVKTLALIPHPEGGFFKEMYRSEHSIPGSKSSGFPNGRPYGTSIYYCLESGDFSALHRLKSDETWYFHDSTPNTRLIVTRICPSEMIGDTLVKVKLGRKVEDGEVFQVTCKAGEWFGAHVEVDGENMKEGVRKEGEGGAVLVGCAVAPGFEFEDFEMGKRQELLKKYPMFKDDVERLTRLM